MAERERRAPGGSRRGRKGTPGRAPDGAAGAADTRPSTDDPAESGFYQPNTNQIRQEPLPASHDDERWQEAVQRNEEHAHGVFRRGFPATRGRAVRDLTPGDAAPGPQEPASQIASGGDGDEEGRPLRARRVAHVAPARPDGEVNPGR